MLGMVVQPVVAEMRAGGGWRVVFHPPWQGWPSDDALADTRAMNEWIEAEVRRCPAQYLWVHKRFKTRPRGEPSLYADDAR
jgi:KDO2-lipid IV(A) lauroyltransferase